MGWLSQQQTAKAQFIYELCKIGQSNSDGSPSPAQRIQSLETIKKFKAELVQTLAEQMVEPDIKWMGTLYGYQSVEAASGLEPDDLDYYFSGWSPNCAKSQLEANGFDSSNDNLEFFKALYSSMFLALSLLSVTVFNKASSHNAKQANIAGKGIAEDQIQSFKGGFGFSSGGKGHDLCSDIFLSDGVVARVSLDIKDLLHSISKLDYIQLWLDFYKHGLLGLTMTDKTFNSSVTFWPKRNDRSYIGFNTFADLYKRLCAL